MNHNEITGAIVDTAIQIHKNLGPGLLESVYRHILAYELKKKAFFVRQEQPIPVTWDDAPMEIGFRADLIVNDKVVVETKSIEAIAPVHKKQVLTYLRLTDMQVGLLLNFNVDLLKNGIFRIVNNLNEPPIAPRRFPR